MKYFYGNVILCLLLSTLLSACGSEQRADRIVIGDSNTLFALNELQYQNPYVVQVSDINGNAVANVSVTIKVTSTAYLTGFYSDATGVWLEQVAQQCVAEDKNNNAILDAGEDVNSSGALEPTNASTVTAHPTLEPTLNTVSNTLVTDEFGFGYFSLTYPKSEANWSRFNISASANVSGTEGTASLAGVLPAIAQDLEDITVSPPGGVVSAYGLTSNCEIFTP